MLPVIIQNEHLLSSSNMWTYSKHWRVKLDSPWFEFMKSLKQNETNTRWPDCKNNTFFYSSGRFAIECLGVILLHSYCDWWSKTRCFVCFIFAVFGFFFFTLISPSNCYEALQLFLKHGSAFSQVRPSALLKVYAYGQVFPYNMCCLAASVSSHREC